MSDEPHWERLATFGTMLEAELARATLESAGIVCLIKSHGATGVFGAGFQGTVPGGVTLMVPSTDAERAWALLVGSSH